MAQPSSAYLALNIYNGIGLNPFFFSGQWLGFGAAYWSHLPKKLHFFFLTWVVRSDCSHPAAVRVYTLGTSLLYACTDFLPTYMSSLPAWMGPPFCMCVGDHSWVPNPLAGYQRNLTWMIVLALPKLTYVLPLLRLLDYAHFSGTQVV